MPVVPYPNLDTLDPDAQALLGEAPRNITRMLAGSGALFKPLSTFSLTFMNKGSLPPTLRELISLRIGHRLNAKYVWGQHQGMARHVGVTEEQISAVTGPLPSPAFSAEQNAAVILADSLIDNVRAPAEQVRKVRDLLGDTVLHELFIVSCFYQFIARYTESLQLDIDIDPNQNGIEYMKARDHLRAS